MLLIYVFVGFCIGAGVLWAYNRYKQGGYKALAQSILQRAEVEAKNYRHSQELATKEQHAERQRELEQFWQNERRQLQREEDRLKQREDKLETRLATVEKKLSEIERKEIVLSSKQEKLEEDRKNLVNREKSLLSDLEKASGLSAAEAKNLLMEKISEESQLESAQIIRRAKQEAEEEADRLAAKAITSAIHRLAVPTVSEATVNTVSIPNDEIKGRIIGREGRNIRCLEQATGITFLFDDTPGAIVLSGYDPSRLHIAKMALQELIADGRVYPTRIEEVVEKAQRNIQKQIKNFGEDAAYRAGIVNLHPEIITLLGKLKLRYSFGQNVLDHSLEVAYLMGIMAAELGLNVLLAKRIGLLHDMGKSVTHEMQGSHAIIGHDLALKYGETQAVANGIGCHHFEMEPITLEGDLCSAADAISASRPGARVEALEEYIKRLKQLEDIACDFSGVDRAYAMQAGREIRVMVLPDMISDDSLTHLTRNITKRIEQEIHYSGKIKVTVIRETRSTQYAT